MKSNNKRLKEAYKSSKRALGIILIRNTTNDKVFLASGMDINGIINRHKFQLASGTHASIELQKDWNDLGPDKFEFEILDQLKPLDDTGFDARRELSFLEEMWLEKLQPFGPRGYNEKKLSREERLRRMAANRKRTDA
jgi:hypothetical protein